MLRISPIKMLLQFIGLGMVSLLGSGVASAGQPDFPTGSPMAESIRFQYAVYYLPVPDKDPLPIFRRWLMENHEKVRIVDDIPEKVDGMVVRTYIMENVRDGYRPPNMDSLRYYGRGISREQAEALQNSKQALILDFVHPAGDGWAALRMATALAEHVSRETGGLLWDEETREVFSPDEWHERRLAGWHTTVPDISKHTTIHAYKNGEYIRAITLGMAKFGLPDVVVNDFAWSGNVGMGNLINLLTQAMAEGASFEKAGEFDLALREIVNPDVRQTQLESLKPRASAIAYLGLRRGIWEEGDPDNRLIEIVFERYPGPDNHARQDKLLSSLFGWEDPVTELTDNNELLAASRRAKAELPALQSAFNAGLEPGEFIQVKAPFDTADGGREWMWVEIIRWRGDRIKGLLKNEPFKIRDLHAGQEVVVDQQDIFDYIRRFSDGSQIGNETGKIIQKMTAN